MAQEMKCTGLAQVWGLNTINDGYASDVSAYLGGSPDGYYTSCTRFKTPEFSGVSEKLAVTVDVVLVWNENPMMRWALTESDENRLAYTGVFGAVEDEHQIAQGAVQFSGLTVRGVEQSFEIRTGDLKPNKTYYLYFWAYLENTESTVAQLNTPGNHSLMLHYNTGTVMIRTEAGMILCQPEILTKDGWKSAAPDIRGDDNWMTGG